MLLGFAGISGSGKDTCANFLVKSQKFVRIGFADSLKRVVAEVFDFSDAQVHGSDKETPDQRYTHQDGSLLTPRRALQWLGTEGFRTCCPDIWVMKALADAQRLLENNYDYSPRRGVKPAVTVDGGWGGVVFSDLRFINEHRRVKEAGGVLIRLKRNMTQIQPVTHQSETELNSIPDSYYDYVIDNNQLSLLELEVEVNRIYADIMVKRL